jgi:hypothetical protein
MLPLPHMALARIRQNHGTQEFAAALARAWPTLQANPLPFSCPQATIVLPDSPRSSPL